MPPHHHHHHPPHPHHGWYRPSPSVLERLGWIQTLLDPRDGGGLSEFAFDDGPDHRRASASILCALIHEIVEEVSRSGRALARPYDGPAAYVELEMPPHMQYARNGTRPGASIPTRLLSMLSRDGRELDEMVGALSWGPGHDVATTAIMLRLLESLYDMVASPVSAPVAPPGGGPLA